MRKTSLIIILAAAAALVLSVVASAETWGRHPRYIHARSDLRTAQWLLRVHDEENVMRHLGRAAEEIDAAVHEQREVRPDFGERLRIAAGLSV